MDVINIQLTSNTANQKSNVDETTFKQHDDDDNDIIYKTPTTAIVVATNEQQQEEQQQYEEDFSSSSSSISLVSWTATEQEKKITEEATLSSTLSKADEDLPHNNIKTTTKTTTSLTECVPNAWQPIVTSEKEQQTLDYRENSDHPQQQQQQQHLPQQQSSSSEDKTNSTTIVESLAVTENSTAAKLMQINGQQKRISKRVRRSSDHHKRAAISNHNRKHHASNNNKANNNATLTTPTSSMSTSTIKNDHVKQEQEQEPEERVVRSDEIALFMRCKKRYSDPDFKPIPPLPGGWEEVTPDRVITWEQTAEMLNDFSSYKNDPDWKNKLPWVRHHHRQHENTVADKKASSTIDSISTATLTADKTITNSTVPAASDVSTTRYHDKHDGLPRKSSTRQQQDVAWRQTDHHKHYHSLPPHPPPPSIQTTFCTISNPPITTSITATSPSDNIKIQEPQTPTSSLVNENNNANNNNNNNIRTTRPTQFPDRFFTQQTSGLLSSKQQFFEQKTPSLWDMSNYHNTYRSSSYHQVNGRRASTFSLDIQTGNQGLHPISAMRRLSHGHDNNNSIYYQQQQQRNNDSLMNSCLPWSPTLPDWSSKYRASIPPPPPPPSHPQQHQQEWTPPVSPWSMDSKQSNSFSNVSSSFPSSTSTGTGSPNHNTYHGNHTWEERFASILKVVDDDTSIYPQQQKQPFVKDDMWPLSPPPSAGILDHPNRGDDYFPTKRRSSYNDVPIHHPHPHPQQPRNLWNQHNNGDNNNKACSTDGLFVANSQLLQNMVQTGHMGCRHCGSGTHATPKECPHIPLMNDQEAWFQLLQAGHRCDTIRFMEAIDIYSKSRPDETLPMIARRLQESGSKLQLVALDKPLLSTTVLVDLQGIMRRKYTVTITVYPPFASNSTPSTGYYGGFDRNINSGVMPESAEQNMARLAEAGFARDLTDIASCMLCKQSGHWAKDCCSARKKSCPPLLTLMPPFQQRRQQSTPNIFNPSLTSMNNSNNNHNDDTSFISRGRFNSLPSSDHSLFDNVTKTNTSAITRPPNNHTIQQFDFPNSNDPDTTRRLYYNLNEYVLVDGI